MHQTIYEMSNVSCVHNKVNLENLGALRVHIKTDTASTHTDYLGNVTMSARLIIIK